MIPVGDSAPAFTAQFAHDDDEVGPFALSNRLDEAPLVFAFFPACGELH